MIFASFAMIAGGAFYGFIIAKLAALMQGLDANARVYHERMDAIVSYMRQRNFPRHLFHKVSRYYQHYFQRKTALDESAILDALSESLQLDVSKFLAHDTFDRSYLFSEISDGILMQLLAVLLPIKSTPDEVIFQMGDPGKDLFVITVGNVFAFDRNGDILLEYGSGAVFGEFAPLGLIGGRLFHTQCRSMVELCSVSRDALKEACYDFPGSWDRFADKARKTMKAVVKCLNLGTRSIVLQALQRQKTVVEGVSRGVDGEASLEGGGPSVCAIGYEGDDNADATTALECTRREVAALRTKIDSVYDAVRELQASQRALGDSLRGLVVAKGPEM